MSKTFVSIGISLDGYVAGVHRGPSNPLGTRGPELHAWAFTQRAFRAMHSGGADGETGPNNDVLAAVIARSGATVIGKNMFDEGEANWPEEAPYHHDVFVVTSQIRDPWPRPGGTTFHFVNDGIESALRQAQAAAGRKDVRIGGGATLIRAYLAAGLVDELELSVVPLLLGEGLRLFDGLDTRKLVLSAGEVIVTPEVTHLRYAVKPA